MTNLPDDRSPLALAAAWTSRVTTISMEMVLPGLLGYWVDRKLGLPWVFFVLGGLLGLAGGTWHLIRLSQESTGPKGERKGPANHTREP